MELEKFEENGVQYVQLYAGCPICLQEGRHTPHRFFVHDACDGDMYIGDDATIKCKKCGVSHHIDKWLIGCQQCKGGSDGVLYRRSPKTDQLSMAATIAGMMVTEVGLPWLSRFMANLESGWWR